MKYAHRIIAIAALAASGTSSVAPEPARRVSFVYVNSGEMYRAITWHVLEQGIDPKDSARIAKVVDCASITSELQNNESHVRINHADPTPHLREDRVNNAASALTPVPA